MLTRGLPLFKDFSLNTDGRGFFLKGILQSQRTQHGAAATSFFVLRRETKRHAALEALPAVEKRCRRRALPPQSKILAVRGVSDEWLCREFLPQGGAEGAKQTKRIL
jgi:hypothetical protein